MDCDDGSMSLDMLPYCYAFQGSITNCCSALNGRSLPDCQEQFRPSGNLFPACAKTCALCAKISIRERSPSFAPTFTPTEVQVPTRAQSEGTVKRTVTKRGEIATTKQRSTIITVEKNTHKEDTKDTSAIIIVGLFSVMIYAASTFLMYSFFFGSITSLRKLEA